MNIKNTLIIAATITVILTSGFIYVMNTDDTVASVNGTGTISDPYTYIDINCEDSSTYFSGTKYVQIGSSISIRSHLDDVYDYYVTYQSSSHGLTWSAGSLTGTLTGNNNDTFTYEVRVTIDEQEDLSEGTFSFIMISSPVTYTVLWKNWNGAVLETDTNVSYGTTPTYNGATPTRPSEGYISYTFSGWSPAISTVTGNQVYTAQYTENFITNVIGNGTPTVPYTTVHINAEDMGTYFTGTKYVAVGTSIVIHSHTVGNTEYYVKSMSTTNGLTWSAGSLTGTLTGTSGNTVSIEIRETIDEMEDLLVGNYSFIVTDTSITYTITWKNYNNTTLETDTGVRYGETPTYDGPDPTRPSSGAYTYTFSGWSPTLHAVNGNQTYTAIFTQSITTRVDGSGTPMDPYTTIHINAENSGTYFAGAKYVSVGADIIIFSRTVGNTEYYVQSISPTNGISWSNGSLTGTLTGTNGGVVGYTVHEVIDETEDLIYGNYSFIVIDPSVTYTVTWKNWDGTVIKTDTGIRYGMMPEYTGITPTRPNEMGCAMVFTNWFPTFSPVFGNQIYTAEYEEEPIINVIGLGSQLFPYSFVGLYANDMENYFDGMKYVSIGAEFTIFPQTVNGEYYYVDGFTSTNGLSQTGYRLHGTITGENNDTITVDVYKFSGGSATLYRSYTFTIILEPETMWTNGNPNGSVSILYHIDKTNVVNNLVMQCPLYEYNPTISDDLSTELNESFVATGHYLYIEIKSTPISGSNYNTQISVTLYDNLNNIVATETKDFGKWNSFVLTIDTINAVISYTKVMGFRSFTNYEETTTTTILDYGSYGDYNEQATQILNMTPVSDEIPRQSIIKTLVFLNTYGVVLRNPTLDIADYFPEMTQMRLNFYSFALYGSSMTINGHTIDVTAPEVTIYYTSTANGNIYSEIPGINIKEKTLELTNIYITWDGEKCYLTFADDDFTVDMGSYTDKVVSFTGMWYFATALWEPYTAQETTYDVDWFNFDFALFGIVFATMLLIASLVLKVTIGAKFLDYIIIVCGIIIGLIIAGGGL